MSSIRIAVVVCVAACGGTRSSPTTRRAEPATCGAPLPAPAQSSPARQVIQAAHGAEVTAFAVAADGRLASYSQFDKTIRIWDLEQRSLLAVVQAEAEMYWDAEAKALVLEGQGGVPAGGGFAVVDLLIGPDGRRVGTRERPMQARPVREGAAIRGGAVRPVAGGGKIEYRDPAGRVYRLDSDAVLDELTVVAGGTELVATVLGIRIVRWKLGGDGTPTVQELDGEAQGIAFTDAGDALVVHEREGASAIAISLYPRDGGPARLITERDTLDGTPRIAVSADGKLGVVATHHALAVHDLATGKVVWSEAGAQFDPSRDRSPVPGFGEVAIAADGRTVIAARSDGSIVLRDLATGRHVGQLGVAVHQPETLAWIDDRHVLAASTSRVAVWDVATGTIVAGYTEPLGFLRASVLGGDVVVARMTNCFGKTVDDARTIAWVDRWVKHEPPPELLDGDVPALRDGCASAGAIAWPPARGAARAPLLLGGAGDGLDLATGASLGRSTRKFLAPTDAVRLVDGTVVRQAFALSPGTREVTLRGPHVFAPLGGYKGVGVWRVADGTWLHALAIGGKGSLLGVSADGARVAVSAPGAVAIFEAASGTQLVAARPPAIVTAVAFGDAPAEAWLGTHDGAVLHLTPDGRTRTLGRAAATWITRLAVSPDRERIIALGDDGGLRVLDRAGRLAATLVEFADEEPIAFTPGGAYAGTAEAADRVAWRFEAPLEIFRFEQFAKAFARPELVARRLAGGTGDIAAKLVRPPTITFAKSAATVGREVEVASGAKPAATGAAATARLEVEVASSRRVDVVRAYREGREVASATACAARQTVTLDVPLLAGINTIAIQAFDDLGHASNPAVTRLSRPGGPRPELHVIAIGIGSYPSLDPELQLPLATEDAKGILAAFRGYAGPGKPYARLHPRLLLDRDATVAAILAALDGLAAMQEDDLAIVSFAGHGVKPSPSDDMVFVTGKVTGLERDGLRGAAIAWPAIAAKLARAKGRVVVLLDACHSGHVSQHLVVPNDRLAAALARDGRAGVIVFAASKGRQSSYEPTGARALVLSKRARPLVTPPTGRHGYFTGALLSALRDPSTDRDGDGVLQMTEWIRATRERVTLATEGLQTPWIARQEMFGDFAIVPFAPHRR